MIEFGKTLREAREAKGYTISQIAEITHLKSSLVEQLENDDFSKIAAPIYGRGFVKLYCETVGLDPKPLVAEFMAIMNGEHEISIKERPISAVLAPREAPHQPPVAPQPSQPAHPLSPPLEISQPSPLSQSAESFQPRAAFTEPSLFDQDAPPVAPPLPPREDPRFEQSPPQAQTISRYAAPIDERPAAMESFPAFNPRLLILAGCAVALLIVFIFGLRALYRATTSDAPKAGEAAEAQPAPRPAPAAQSAPRAPQKIPSLYID